MSYPPSSNARYYVVIDGRPMGPHTAAEVMEKRRAGLINENSLLCEEGATGWSRLGDFPQLLQPTPPPLPPPGYLPQHPRFAPAPTTAPPVPAADGTKVARLGTLVAALILFFVPWLEVRCSGTPLLTQTGIQTVTNDASPAGPLKDEPGLTKSKKTQSTEGELGNRSEQSYFVGAALLLAVGALGAAFGRGGRLSGVLAAAALACLAAQAIMGFPVQKALSKAKVETGNTLTGPIPGSLSRVAPAGIHCLVPQTVCR